MATLTLQQLIDNRLTPRLGMTQRLEAYFHRGTHTSSTEIKFPYNRWFGTILFYKNGVLFTPTSYDVDNGTAVVSDLIASDDVDCSYNFKYFSNSDLQNFYKLAISKLNNTPPASAFTFDDATAGTSAVYPVDTEDFLTNYTYKLCLETILVDLMTWRARLIWTDPTALAGLVQGVVSSLEASLASGLKTLKGRRFLTPHTVSAGRFTTPAQVAEQSFQMYTTIRSN